MELSEYFSFSQKRVNECIKQKLERMPDSPQDLKAAMEYALLLGGKRARPFLVYATGSAFGAKYEDLDYVAAAVECIHAYSLVHDDMPEMDNDKLRRGMPTVHVKFGPTIALLAGDTLQSLAFEFLTDSECKLAFEVKGQLCAALAKASGFSGMCGGQALDLASENKVLEQSELEHLHSLKTGALINCAIKMGYIAARYESMYQNQRQDAFASAYSFIELPQLKREQESLSKYGEKVGLAFQVWDDVLDVAGSSEVLGKEVGSDVEKQKSTYVRLMGVAGATNYANELVNDACKHIKGLDIDSDLLCQFAHFCVERDH